MKMTVGPLPAGVYWRRRAIVGGVLLIVVLMLWTSCGGGNDPSDNKTSGNASGAAPTTSSASTSAEPTIQVPTTGEASPSASPSASSAAPTVTSTVPLCADADLSLTAAPEQPAQFRGAYLKFFLRIKNISNHDCARDVGADYQELYLQSGGSKIWSSDKCDPPHGSELRTLKPGIEVEYSNTWNGKATDNGCENREAPPAGKYQLIGRLDTKISEPVTVQLT
ncbi:adhesin [Dactylosporangium sp. NPDC005572]|uniref:adhesin n=1 Tax=Dactylosporangium sp. NPDC005572 TaxID=3156889 RepID=UPI0033B43CEE